MVVTFDTKTQGFEHLDDMISNEMSSKKIRKKAPAVMAMLEELRQYRSVYPAPIIVKQGGSTLSTSQA